MEDFNVLKKQITVKTFAHKWKEELSFLIQTV